MRTHSLLVEREGGSVELGGGKLGDRSQLDRNLPRERLLSGWVLEGSERVNETMRHGQVS